MGNDAYSAGPVDATVRGWQPIETAPKDGTLILGWCVHDADEYWIEERKRMTVYGAHSEGLSHVEDGPHVLEWGGALDDRTWEDNSGGYMPDWWFRYGSEFEETANPTHWMPLPEAPNVELTGAARLYRAASSD